MSAAIVRKRAPVDRLPGHACLCLLVLLTACGGGGGGSSSPDRPPTLYSLSSSQAAPGEQVEIFGADFERKASGNLVFFGAAEARVVSADSDRLVCEVPAGIATRAQLELSVSTRGGTSQPLPFTAIALNGAPRVTEVRTSTGAPTDVAFAGQTLRLSGSGFSPQVFDNVVWVGGRRVEVLAARSDELEIRLPSAAQSGVVGVEVGGVGSVDGPTLFVCGDRPGAYDDRKVGEAARDLLRAFPYTHLVIELDVQSDGASVWAPETSALAALALRLRERLHKPGGIVILAPQTFTSTRTAWNDDTLDQTAQAVRNLYGRGNTALIHMSFVAGSYTDNDRVIGLTYRATEIAVFEERLRDRLGPGVTSPSRAEEAVMTHECGHVLGLVNIGIGMCNDHLDPNSRGHDIDASCVMNAEISIRQIGLRIQSTDFDAACKCDLQRAGGR